MKHATKIWLIVAAVLVVVGMCIFAGAMTMQNWNFTTLGNRHFETHTYTVTQNFDNLSISARTDDISFVLSDDKDCKVVCYEQEKMQHTVGVSGKMLEIGVNDTRAWYDHFAFFSFTNPKITVYLPKEQYASLVISADTGDINIPSDFAFDAIDISASTGDVECAASTKGLTKIKLSTGDISVHDITAGELELTASTGEINLQSASCEGNVTLGISTGETLLRDVACKKLTSDGTTGDLLLENVTISGALSIERSTGDVSLDGCDADDIIIKTTTGDVIGSLRSEKVFTADTLTGDVNVPQTTRGGACEVTTTTGDIIIRIEEQS